MTLEPYKSLKVGVVKAYPRTQTSTQVSVLSALPHPQILFHDLEIYEFETHKVFAIKVFDRE